MDTRFLAHNSHLENAELFAATDPNLKRLYSLKYVFRSSLLNELSKLKETGIYTLTGGRQIGKSTLLKQWIEDLLKAGVDAKTICFFSGELINDHQTLYDLMQRQLAFMPAHKLKYFILDEVTYIKEWDKTIKYLADIGALEKVILMLSGSDSLVIQEARKRFPGRRGKANKVDFHYYPLSFKEFLQLKKKMITTEPQDQKFLSMLYKEFDHYLIHGGFLTAINDFAEHKKIIPATLNIYSDWIRGDVLKHNKKEHFLKEIMGAIIKHYTKQVSWVNLVKELSIDHTQTIADYMGLLESMDTVFVQSAIIEDKLQAAPKKQKKLMFNDPFIYHAMKAWLHPTQDPYNEQIEKLFSDPSQYSDIVEAVVITHYQRYFPTFYIKAEGEVDIAYVNKNHFWPIEIKWTNQLRPKDLKQISKYKNGIIYGKNYQSSEINNIPVKPLPLALLDVECRVD